MRIWRSHLSRVGPGRRRTIAVPVLLAAGSVVLGTVVATPSGAVPTAAPSAVTGGSASAGPAVEHHPLSALTHRLRSDPVDPLRPSGTVTGSVQVTGAPAGFQPASLGVGACPASLPVEPSCPNPRFELSSASGYSLVLPTGSWRIYGFYETSEFGGQFLGAATTVDIAGGAMQSVDLSVAYLVPATVTGTITVSGIPKRSSTFPLAILCPSYLPQNDATLTNACVEPQVTGVLGSGSTRTASYRAADLPPGSWTVYAGYGSNVEFVVQRTGTMVTLRSGTTRTVDVAIAYQAPTSGLLVGRATVTGAPAGSSHQVVVLACRATTGRAICPDQYGNEAGRKGDYVVELSAGAWRVEAAYLEGPFGVPVPGASQLVTVRAGAATVLDLTVGYRPPGAAAGAITVEGLPAATAVQQYNVEACPASDPLTGRFPGADCVGEFSGYEGLGSIGIAFASSGVAFGTTFAANRSPASFNQFRITGLTPGTWLLYPGYMTNFGGYMKRTGIPVTVTAGSTAGAALSVFYQPPTSGAVVGKVALVGAPADAPAEAAVEACAARPSKTECVNQQLAFSDGDGNFTLALPAGEWWVAGAALNLEQSSGPLSPFSLDPGPSQLLTVAAGQSISANFVAPGS